MKMVQNCVVANHTSYTFDISLVKMSLKGRVWISDTAQLTQ